MFYLIYGLLIGVLVGGMGNLLFDISYESFFRKRLRTAAEGPLKNKWLGRIRKLLSRKSAKNWLTIPAVVIAALVLFPLSFGLEISLLGLGTALGMLGVLLVVINTNGKLRWKDLRKRILNETSRELVFQLPPKEAEELFSFGLANGDELIREQMVSGLSELGTKNSLKILEELNEDPDRSVRDAALDAQIELKLLHAGKNLLSANKLNVLIREHEYWVSVNTTGSEKAPQKVSELTAMIDEIVRSQLIFRHAWPEILCTKCNCRATKQRYLQWEYVLCRNCGDVMDMVTGVKKFIGVIGPEPTGEAPSGTRYISIWDDKNKNVTFAEVDIIEVREGGDFEYDWAVQAVIEKYLDKFVDNKISMNIQLVGKPPLSKNTLNQMHDFDLKYGQTFLVTK